MIAFPAAKEAARLLAAVAEPTRLRVFVRLAGGPAHVGELAKLVGVPMVNMSHHLGVMRLAGLLEDEKHGRRVVYCLRPGVTTPPRPDELAAVCAGPYRLGIKRDLAPPPRPTLRRAVRKTRSAG